MDELNIIKADIIPMSSNQCYHRFVKQKPDERIKVTNTISVGTSTDDIYKINNTNNNNNKMNNSGHCCCDNNNTIYATPPQIICQKSDINCKQTIEQLNHNHNNNNLDNDDNCCDLDNKKYRKLLKYEDAPEHLQFNPFIRSGYRTYLPTRLCLESVFWWTNETVNIWTHIFGLFLFIGLTYNEMKFLNMHAGYEDKVIVVCLSICFQLCMILSSIYHTFSCRSAKDYDCFLAFDLFGIALSLLAIYISGIYYAFWCHTALRNFYTISVCGIFLLAMILQIPKLNINSNIKMLVFVAWAAYGVVPTLHWAIELGGFDNQMVRLLVPRVIGMYLISGTAFLIYITKIPERWFAGRVDYLGHSHNWWHLFVVAALYYWHNTGFQFGIYMLDNGCAEDRAKCYRP